MRKPPPGSSQVLVSIFFISLSLLIYQVVLTRLFSAILLYHYVFLVTSFAVFGLGLGGIAIYKARLFLSQDTGAQCSLLSFATGVSCFIVFSVITFSPYLGGIVPYAVISIIPFITGGMLVALLFSRVAGQSGKLYGADLLGAAVGCILSVIILDSTGMLRSCIIISTLPFIPVLVFPSNKLLVRAAACVVIFSAVLFFQNGLLHRLETNFAPVMTAPGKYIEGVDRERGRRSSRIVYTKWDAFSRTDVIEVDGFDDRKTVTIDGVAFSGMYAFDGDLDKARRYPDLSGYFPSICSLPFAFGPNDRVFIVGSAGGRDILYALMAGSKKITAVEINRSTIEAVRHFKTFNGGICDRPEVRVIENDGRYVIENTPDIFDVILLPLVKTEATGMAAFSLIENYIFTKEAIGKYLERLSPSGRIAVLAHHEAALAKMVSTAMEVLAGRGVPDQEIPRYLAVVNSKNLETAGDVRQPLLIIKKEPFSIEESEQLLKNIQSSGNIALFLPYLYEKARLADIRKGIARRADFARGLPYSCEPATDNRPFFYNFKKGLPDNLLYGFIASIILSFMVSFPYIIRKKAYKTVLFFSVLGIGFMVLEISLIQTFIRYLGHPTLAFAFSVGGLLLGGALGSFALDRGVFAWSRNRRQNALLYVFICGTLAAIFFQPLFSATYALPLPARIAVSMGLMLPLGFFMGIPFPSGLKAVRSNEEIPFLWGINGLFTVVGSILAVAIAMLLGITAAVVIGAGCYLFLFLFYRNL